MAGVRLEFTQRGHFDHFNIYREEESTDATNISQPIATTTTMYYEDLSAQVGRDYYYRVGVVRNNNETISNEVHVTTITEFDPPYNIQGTWNNATQSVELTWEFDE